MPGIVGLIGPGANEAVRPMCATLAHRGAVPKVFKLGESGVVAILDDGKDASWIARDGLQLAAHVRDYDANPAGLCGETAASRLLQTIENDDWDQLRGWNGGFALAAWDSRENQLLLGRDYLGEFPLSYGTNGRGLFGFASEYKALLAMPHFVPLPDPDMLRYLQCTKKLPDERSLLKNVYSVEPGAQVRFDAKGAELQRKKMPTLSSGVKYRSLAETTGPTLALLRDSTSKRTQGADPIGIALSGGIDSIAIAFICRELYPNREICTFTAGYGDDDPDVMMARRVAKLVKSEHVEVATPPELMHRRAKELVWYMEDPIARSEALQLLALGQEAVKRVPLLLSGQGADGLFGGMPRHRLIRYMELLPMLRTALQQVYDFTQSGIRPDSLIAKVAVKALGDKTPDPPHIRGSDYNAKRAVWPDTTKNLLNTFLAQGFTSNAKFERTLAASGLDYTSPFYDPALVEHAYSIDSRIKITSKTQKYVMREAVRGVVPDEILNVPKRPQKMRYDLEFSEVIESLCKDLLGDEEVVRRGWFDREEIAKLIRRQDGVAYPAEHAMRIWTAMLTEIWGQLFVDGDSLTRSQGLSRQPLGRVC